MQGVRSAGTCRESGVLVHAGTCRECGVLVHAGSAGTCWNMLVHAGSAECCYMLVHAGTCRECWYMQGAMKGICPASTATAIPCHRHCCCPCPAAPLTPSLRGLNTDGSCYCCYCCSCSSFYTCYCYSYCTSCRYSPWPVIPLTPSLPGLNMDSREEILLALLYTVRYSVLPALIITKSNMSPQRGFGSLKTMRLFCTYTHDAHAGVCVQGAGCGGAEH